MNLTFEGPTFFGQADEDLFFSVLYRLPAYQNVTGSGLDLHLTLKDPIDTESADQLLSLFLRWGIDTGALLHLRPANSATPRLWEIQSARTTT
jgi:hypothetical protein